MVATHHRILITFVSLYNNAIILSKESLNSDGQQFHQYQQNEQ